MTQTLQCRVSVSGGQELMAALSTESALSVESLEDAAVKGAVWISRCQMHGNVIRESRPVRLRSLAKPLAYDAVVLLNYNQHVLALQSQELVCVSDHVNYGIWNKPAGMLCQGSKWSDHTTATQVASGLIGKPCYLVHRLDRAASGLLLIAYTRNATRHLTQLFQQRAITKLYRVSVSGQFDRSLPCIIESALDGKSACSEILSATPVPSNNSSMLNVSIRTGRKHQIRRHLAALDYPVLGDRLYAPQTVHEQDLQLQACALSFDCPFTGKPVQVSLT